MSAGTPRPPITTPFWIGDTVYMRYGPRAPGLLCAVVMEGDAAYPTIKYRVTFQKLNQNDEYYGFELTSEKPAKEF